jgi:hypothetical protein
LSEFLVDADTLVNARFGTSQLTETVSALKLLRVPVEPWFRPWKDAHRAAFQTQLKRNPVWAAIVDSAFGTSWAADFFTVPPLEPDLALEDELGPLIALSDDRIRADLSVVRTPLPPILLDTSGLAAAAAGLLRWIWTRTIEPEWPRRVRVLQADIVSRTSRLSEQGWSGVLRGLGPDVRWLGDGRIQVNRWNYPVTDVRGHDLMFIAAHTQRVNVSWRLPDRFALAYPVTGIFATTATPDEPLVQLLGRNPRPDPGRGRLAGQHNVAGSNHWALAGDGLGPSTGPDRRRVAGTPPVRAVSAVLAVRHRPSRRATTGVEPPRAPIKLAQPGS